MKQMTETLINSKVICIKLTVQRFDAGASIPPTTMALFPHSHVFFCPPPFPLQTIFGHCIRNFAQSMRVFSEFWKLSVRDSNPPKQKNM